MTSTDSSRVDPRFLNNAMASFIQIGAVLLLLTWSYRIISPFIEIVVWGLIMAVAVYPLHVSLSAKLGGKEKWSSILLVLIGLAILLIPTWILTDSTIQGLHTLSADLENGQLSIPPPDQTVADWPVVGSKVFEVWTGLTSNVEATLNEFEPQLLAMGQSAVTIAGSIAVAVLQFVFSIIIAGVFLLQAEGGYGVARNIGASLGGKERGSGLTDLSIQIVRSVTKGVLGVAIIQTILAAIGLVVMDIPAAGLWAGVVLVLAIIQLPPILVLGPIAVWVFSVADPVPATIFAVYAVLVSISDMVLKPMLLGRGVNVPILVILIGAIGGAISAGIIGLFVGAVILALAYELFLAWIAPDEVEEPKASAET